MQIKQTKKLESVLLGGCYEARRRSSSEVTTDHLFLAILKQEESHASHVLRKLLKNWEIDQIKTRLEREMGPVVAQDGGLRLSDRRLLSTANRCCAKSFPMWARAASWNTCSTRDIC